MKEINLNGNWELKLDLEKEGLSKKFFNHCDFDDFMELPGTVSEQKKSKEISAKNTGNLTDPYLYEGWIWLKKEIDLASLQLEPDSLNFCLFLERTRYSTLWINNKEIGSINTINGFHEYNFSLTKDELNSKLSILLLISNVDYIVPGGHMTSADTQTNWIGITGQIKLIQKDNIFITKPKITTEVNQNKVKLIIDTDLYGAKAADYNISIGDILNENVKLSEGHNCIEFDLTNKVLLWSDSEPNLYKLFIENIQNHCIYEYQIGFRNFSANGKFFEINGNKIFLRGKHDGMIFPLTGYAPCDLESWLKVLKTAKSYGINHYRFHTCCPPEAAFEAADITGIYMSPELPFWGTIQAPGEEGFNEKQQNYLISEGYKILDSFGNHPSFVMMSMGNELWGSENRLDEILFNYKKYDSRHLYTGGSNNFQFFPRTTENEDYFVGVRFSKDALIRGSYAMCDAPLGFVQTDEPNTNHNYDTFFTNVTSSNQSDSETEIEIQYGTGVKKVKANNIASHFIPEKPCISHEVGQYCMYPDFKEIEKYKGVLKPYNYIEFKNRLEKADLIDYSEDFFVNSSRLAVQCYKTEIEAALRSNELSGFQLLDIQDFTGQGTAVVGILDAFMDSKKIVEPEQWKSFCNETVLLASFDKYVFEENDCLRASIIFHNYSKKDYSKQFITAYMINTENNEILCEESFEIKNNIIGNQELGVFTYKFENISNYKKYSLLLILQDQDDEEKSFVNSYILHVYPKIDSEISKLLKDLMCNESVEYNDILITKNSNIALSSKDQFSKIILLPENYINLPGINSKKEIETIKGNYCTDFWCYPMFRSISESMNKPVPEGTLGLFIRNENKIFSDFPTDSYTTPKWYNLITHSNFINLSGTNITPIVQIIDNFERNWKLGLLYQYENIIICTSRLWEISDKPEIISFLKSLINN